MYYSWKPYVSAAARRKKAERLTARLQKKGQRLAPVTASRGAIGKTFWGKAWCQNLERYSDYSNRLPRGRTYLRNGSVLDLQIAAGGVAAQVIGSSLYKVKVSVTAVPTAHWQAIGTDCASSIDSIVELLQGRLSTGVMERICRPGTGLFPSPREIDFDCSCPDSAMMCKHVAAVLYGVGARLDAQPELLFTLRKVDAKDLVARAGQSLPLSEKRPAAARVLESSKLAEIFGIEMAEPIALAPARRKATTTKKKSVAQKKSQAARIAKQASARKRRAPAAR
jgi:uncharacterized Zn finger protein